MSDELGFRDRIALRAIFTKALSRDHQLKLVADEFARNPRLKSLEVTQLVARDGWLGISLGEAKQPLVANESKGPRR